MTALTCFHDASNPSWSRALAPFWWPFGFQSPIDFRAPNSCFGFLRAVVLGPLQHGRDRRLHRLDHR